MKKTCIVLLTLAFLGGCTSATYTNTSPALETNSQNVFFPDSPVSDQMTLVQTMSL